MSKWNHNICERCWHQSNPKRKPVLVLGHVEDACCFCGCPTYSGIYVREDPEKVPCHGEHKGENE